MPASTRVEAYLLKEYDSNVQTGFHVDELRTRLTSFFLTIAGAAVAAMSLLITGNSSLLAGVNIQLIVAAFLAAVALIGILVLIIVARLRRIQLESFRITNNIREYFLGTDLKLWNVVELSSRTLPRPTMKSGTYFWSLTIVLANSMILGMAAYLLGPAPSAIWLTVAGSLLLQHILYFSLAQPPAKPVYSKDNLPWKAG